MTSQQVEKSTNRKDEQLDRDRYGGRFRGDLPQRTFQFGCAIVDIIDELPSDTKGWTIGKQILRCGTSIGANVAEADHAISDAEFIQRCSISRKEAAETLYWLRICEAKELVSPQTINPLLSEADELLRILSTIVRKWQTRS